MSNLTSGAVLRRYSEDHNENLAFRTGFAEGVASQKNLLISISALLASFVEDGTPITRSEARDLLARARNARAAIAKAQGASA